MDSPLLPFAPLLVVIVQVFKEAGIPAKFCPLLSLVFGVGLTYVVGTPVLDGLVVGVAAVGLFSGGRAIKESLTS